MARRNDRQVGLEALTWSDVYVHASSSICVCVVTLQSSQGPLKSMLSSASFNSSFGHRVSELESKRSVSLNSPLPGCQEPQDAR